MAPVVASTKAPVIVPTKAPTDIFEELKKIGAACKMGCRSCCLEYNAILATLPSAPPIFVPMKVVTRAPVAPTMAPTKAPTKCKLRRCTSSTEDADTIDDGK